MANMDPWIYQSWDQVPRRSKYPLLTAYTHRVGKREQSVVKIYEIRIGQRSSKLYNRTIVFVSMERWRNGAIWRWCDDDDAMVRQCDGDGAMTRWTDAKVLWQLSKTLSRHRYRVIVPSLSPHRIVALSTFFTHGLFLRKCHQLWIFSKHENKGILDHSFTPETLLIIFVVYDCKFIKEVSNALYFICLHKNQKKISGIWVMQ